VTQIFHRSTLGSRGVISMAIRKLRAAINRPATLAFRLV
jgi:hypothetical protein